MQRILIDESNISAFSGMLNQATIGKIITGQETAIGVVANTENGENIPAGTLSFYIDEPFVRITWIYVLPEWRKTGFATEMVRTAIEGFLYDDESKISSILAFYREDAAIDALFTTCGFEIVDDEETQLVETTIADCCAIPLTQERNNNYDVELSQLTNAQIVSFLNKNPDMQQILEKNPEHWTKCYLPSSRAYVTKSGIKGLILFTMRNQDLYLDYIYSEKPETMSLPYLINSALKSLAENYPSDTPIYMATTNILSAKLAQKLLSKMKIINVHIAMLDLDDLLDEMAQYADL